MIVIVVVIIVLLSIEEIATIAVVIEGNTK
jgi:hypothetical protein